MNWAAVADRLERSAYNTETSAGSESNPPGTRQAYLAASIVLECLSTAIREGLKEPGS